MGLRNARAVGLAVLVLVLSACGDDDAGTGAAVGQTPSTTNRPPAISGTPPTTAIEDAPYEFTPQASDPDGDPLIFTVSGKPNWMDFDTSTGKLSGTPNGNNVGRHRGIVISVSDGEDETLLDPIDIEVMPSSAADNRAPQISGTPPSTATTGSFYDFVPTVSDPDGDTLTFSIEARPGWASFDTATGRLSGTPAAGDVGVDGDIVIRVSDGIATASLGPFVITVNAPANGNRAPLITGLPDPDVRVGETWSFTPQASDPDGDTLTFSVFNAPDWATFDAATGQLSGSPLAGNAGTYSDISIVVSDGQASTALPSFSVEVVPLNRAPTISGTPESSVSAGSAYSFTPQAADADSDALTFSIVNRPGWANFSVSTGRLSGTPGAGAVGNYTGIEITVSDGQATATLGPFAIEVTATNTAPVISGTPPGSVIEGQAYSFTPQVADADDDTLTFSAGNLPSWASFDTSTGRLSGTPDASRIGVYSNITITVSDGTASDTLGPFAISVVAIAMGTATLTWEPPSENTDGTPLTDLAGYTVYWGTTPGTYSNSVTLDSPGITTYVIDNLLPGNTYYFVATAFNSDGVESSFSNEASKTIL